MYVPHPRLDWHRLLQVNTKEKTGLCSICGPTKIVGRGITKVLLKRKWGCRLKRKEKKFTRPHRQYLKMSCEQCGFVPVDTCQLDIDHIDGNHRNNTITNLMTLCANCHRLKTHKRGGV